METKQIVIIAVVAVAIIGVSAAAVVMWGGSNDSSENNYDISVSSGSTISDSALKALADDADKTNISIGVKTTDTSANVSVPAESIKYVSDAGKTVSFQANDGVAKLSAEELASIGSASGNVTFQITIVKNSSAIVAVLGEDYTEVRAMASFKVLDSSSNPVATTGSISFEIPYKLNSKERETAARALQWDSTLATTAATYNDGKATLTANAGENVYLAFMTPDDAEHYPYTFTTRVNGFTDPVTQTITHRPYVIATLWEQPTELAILFGLQDQIKYAYASNTYTCVNASAQAAYDALDTKKTYDSGITNSVEPLMAEEPDLIIGWASSFQPDGKWGVGTPSDWNARGTVILTSNNPNKTLEDYYTILEKVGGAVNNTARADELANEFKDAVDTFNSKLETAGITESTKKKVIVIEGAASSTTFIYGKEYFTGDLIAKAGGIDVVPGAMVRLTTEEILEYCLDSDNNLLVDAVFLFQSSGKDAAGTIQDFKDNPAYATLSSKIGENVFVFQFAELYQGGVVKQNILDKVFGYLYPTL